jgi:hypothetical protein
MVVVARVYGWRWNQSSGALEISGSGECTTDPNQTTMIAAK